MRAIFTGFDSAWGAANSGALCDLLLDDGTLRLVHEPARADWASAVTKATQTVNADLHVWAIDQPLLVRNLRSCRPVDRDVARALMRDFGCGAYPSNGSIAAWKEGAPIWNLLSALRSQGYEHNPMAVPGAAGGRFFFECYPHPALIGLFDLNRILKYKVRHRNQSEWEKLVQLIRSLGAAELPISGIEAFVGEALPQNKRNEDKLDSIVAAYVAAYWWSFGTERSTLIGDLSTGCMVTPHSERTLAAFSQVFAGRMNLGGAASSAQAPLRDREEDGMAPGSQSADSGAGLQPAPDGLPKCDWVYFATPARWSGTVTGNFVLEHKVIVRSIHNSARLLIANVQHLRPGERILLVHGGHGAPYRALFGAVISASTSPARSSSRSFDVFTCIDERLNEQLLAGGYALDPVIQRFTGIAIAGVQDLRSAGQTVRRPSGNNAIWRWEEVFSEHASTRVSGVGLDGRT